MQYEIFRTAIFVLLFTISTFSVSKALWMLGLKGKVESFSKLWGAISLLTGGIVSAVALIILSRLL